MKPPFVAYIALGLAALAACGETGQEHIRLPLFAQGTAQTELTLEDAMIQLTRADVALGPLYFCAASGADVELCQTAMAEFLDTVVLDTLEAAPRRLGDLAGVSGQVRSALYDYGVSWLATQQAPEARTELGHSAVLEGTITREARAIRFRALIDLVPRTRGGMAVFGQPTRHELGEGDQLTLSLDPYLWLGGIDLEALFARVPEDSDEVRIEAGSQAYEAILQGMQNRAPVAFTWE